MKKPQAKFIKKQWKRKLEKRCSGVSLTDHISRILHWKNVILEIFYETDDIQGTFLLKKKCIEKKYTKRISLQEHNLKDFTSG